MKLITWEGRVGQVKRQIADIVKIKSQKDIQIGELERFYARCQRSELFTIEKEMTEAQEILDAANQELLEEMHRYPALFFYPTDQSVLKELHRELEFIENTDKLQHLEQRLITVRLS